VVTLGDGEDTWRVQMERLYTKAGGYMGNNKMMLKGDSQSRLLSMHDYTSRAALMEYRINA